ncbi:multicopper oxidase family protein [Rhodocaloribacter litoris]|uniref:multicopper oxidase family protein n=1 Tax=Rhodocaloribacter litoris TaxID=2558931 RepID=UPI0014231904|nr:multicopper oxidase family protein [Rhodocaloribacter litoris]QXD13952.1 multicopper oxidase family protein [Rhodocaloribacter litoris]
MIQRLAFLGLFLCLATAAPAQHHGHHGMHGPADSLAWRMPPMDMSMPMLPGLEGALPTAGPYLPGQGIDPARLPEARPREVVALADGDTLELRAGLVRRTLGGKTLVMYGYNGQYPGPLLRVRQGTKVVVRFHNDIEQPTTVHWHGLRLDNRFDGVPGLTQAPVGRGETFTYEVRFPDAGIYWYHPHVREDVQQDLGLYGNMLVDPPGAGSYGPVHREEVLILDDLLLDDAGLIPYGDDAPTHTLMGRFGNVMLVNGAPDYRLTVRRGEVVRFYLTNVANARTFNVVFEGGRAKVVASDVSRYEREAWVGSVPIAPAERYVVEVRFDAPGTYALKNAIQAVDHFRGEFYPHVDTLGLVTVLDEPAPPGPAAAFDTLRAPADVRRDLDAFRPFFDKPVDHTLTLGVRVKNLPLPIMLAMELDTLYVPPVEWNDAMPMMNWLSTAHEVTWLLRDAATGRENMDVHWDFRQGDVVKLRVFNDPETFHPMHHPIHIHGQRFLVLSMDGVPNDNLVWKDTAIIPVGSTVDLLVDMSNPGDWMLHCHIAEHLHAGMMLSFTVHPATGGTR